MIARWSLLAASLLAAVLHPAPAVAQSVAVPDVGSTDFLSAARVARLPAPERAAWAAYIESAHRLHIADTAAMSAELRIAKLARMTKAPHARDEFASAWEKKTDAWFRKDSAAKLADAVLTFQTPSGGWSKRTDMTRPRKTGQSYSSESEGWQHIPTLDDGATTGQLRFLARVAKIRGEPRFTAAYRRGIAFLLAAQVPTGCWPQSFPLEGTYQDAITFTDDAVVNVMRTLEEASTSSLLSEPERRRAAEGVRRGLDCIVATQVVVNGRPTAWGRQHDPMTLQVVGARRDDPAGLAARESAGIVTYLMSLRAPDSRVVAAVHAAAEWLRETAIADDENDPMIGLALARYDRWARINVRVLRVPSSMRIPVRKQ